MATVTTTATARLAGLTTKRFGQTFVHHAVCGSTSDELARAAEASAPEGTVVMADAQTQGRGRLGRSWHSPAGANLYFSLLLRPEVSPVALPPLTLLVGAVLAQTLDEIGVSCRLKWPNDIMLPSAAGLKKAGGVLTEMATAQNRIRHVVVGIGLNVGRTSFPPELSDVATSLQNNLDPPPERLEVLRRFVNAFEPAYDCFLAEGVDYALASWRQYGWLGQQCRVERESGTVQGQAVDVDNNGALVVQDEQGKRHAILSGEVVTKL